MPNTRTTIKITLIFLLGVMLIAGLVYGWVNFIGWRQSTQQEKDISDWKTYRNEKYGFELKYPPMWFVEEMYTLSERVGDDLLQKGWTGPIEIQVATISIDDPALENPYENTGWVDVWVIRDPKGLPLSEEFMKTQVEFLLTGAPARETTVQGRRAWISIKGCDGESQRSWFSAIVIIEQKELYHLKSLVNPESVMNPKTPIASCETLRQILLSFRLLK